MKNTFSLYMQLRIKWYQLFQFPKREWDLFVRDMLTYWYYKNTRENEYFSELMYQNLKFPHRYIILSLWALCIKVIPWNILLFSKISFSLHLICLPHHPIIYVIWYLPFLLYLPVVLCCCLFHLLIAFFFFLFGFLIFLFNSVYHYHIFQDGSGNRILCPF